MFNPQYEVYSTAGNSVIFTRGAYNSLNFSSISYNEIF